MKKCIALLTLLICIRLSAQTYIAPDIKDRMVNQKTMAILPGQLPVPPTRKQLKRLSPEQIMEMQDSAGLSFQRMVYRWFITQAHTNTLEVQDPMVTDSLLQAAGLSVKDVIYGEKTNIARIVGVDVVMSATLRTKDETTTDSYGPGTNMTYTRTTTDVFLSIRLSDGQTGDPMWEYEGDRDGGYYIRQADEKSVMQLLIKAYKKYPYVR